MHPKRLTTAALTFLTLLALSPAASAHKLALFASVENGVINARAYYQDNQPAANIALSISGPSGNTLANLRTDAEGRATYTIQSREPHTIIAETEDAHRAKFTIDIDDIPESPTTANATQESPTVGDLDERIAQAVAREVRPLREQLDRHENAIRVRDVLGGIGYIAGLAGLVALLKARRNSAG